MVHSLSKRLFSHYSLAYNALSANRFVIDFITRFSFNSDYVPDLYDSQKKEKKLPEQTGKQEAKSRQSENNLLKNNYEMQARFELVSCPSQFAMKSRQGRLCVLFNFSSSAFMLIMHFMNIISLIRTD